MKRILIVEDDPTINQNIKEALKTASFHAESVFDGFLAEKMLKKHKYDCVVLDINVPGKNGYEVTREFRKSNTTTPVLMLTAFDELEDKVEGYDSGADDYLTKPFYMKELVLRINSLIKRSAAAKNGDDNNSTIVAGDIVIERGTGKVTRQGKDVHLTPREYQILVRLIQAKGELVPKKELIREIWGTNFDANTNTIEVYINFLRKKIDKPFGRDSIKTRIGFGYFFDEH